MVWPLYKSERRKTATSSSQIGSGRDKKEKKRANTGIMDEKVERNITRRALQEKMLGKEMNGEVKTKQ